MRIDPDQDFASDLRGEPLMNISGTDIPKSTLAVGAVLWSILFAMQAWHLITTLNMKDKQTEQGGDIRVMSASQLHVTAQIQDLKQIVAAHEQRLMQLEQGRSR